MSEFKFINRNKELDSFENWWKEEKAHLLVIYGKRRVGKTELIKHFLAGKTGIYYLADQRSEQEQLVDIGKRIGEYFHDTVLKNVGFGNWLDLFSYISTKKQKKFLLIFDEFPYLISLNQGLVSLFQKGWDEYLKKSHTFLVLCGSSISMMERSVLSYRAPLYGRRSGQIMLTPMNFIQAHKFFPKMSFEEFLRLYSIVGGMPAYLSEYEENSSLESFISKKIFDRSSYLFRELDFLIKEELREPQNYLSILSAIARSRNRFGEIANTTGLAVNIISKYVRVLSDLQFIDREIPPTIKNPARYRKGLYVLQDQFIKFWFKYGAAYKSDLELGQFSFAISSWKASFDVLVAQNYQKLTVEFIRQNSERIGTFDRLGRYWDKGVEIDLVGINESEDTILFGEAKWSKKAVGTDIYMDLKTKAGKVVWGKPGRHEKFCLFSKSGFTKDMIEMAKKEKALLFEKDKILEY